jgi:hypothetical protein
VNERLLLPVRCPEAVGLGYDVPASLRQIFGVPTEPGPADGFHCNAMFSESRLISKYHRKNGKGDKDLAPKGAIAGTASAKNFN